MDKKMNKGYRIFGIIIVAAILLTVVYSELAWIGNDENSNPNDEFTFVYQDRVADAALVVAFEKGFFEDEGLNAKPMRFSSGPACAEALLYGDVQFGTMGDTTAIIAASKNQPVTIIASHSGGEERHRIIVSDKSGIESIEDLEGKRIGVKMGTSTHGGLLLFASSNGLDLDDELIDMQPCDQLNALSVGELDAIVASEPTPSIGESNGFGREFATLGGYNNTYPILTLVDNEFAAEKPETVRKVLKVLVRSTEYIRENPGEAAMIQANITGLDVDVVERAMGFHYYAVSMDENTILSLENGAEFLMDNGKIASIPDMQEHIDVTYLEDTISLSDN